MSNGQASTDNGAHRLPATPPADQMNGHSKGSHDDDLIGVGAGAAIRFLPANGGCSFGGCSCVTQQVAHLLWLMATWAPPPPPSNWLLPSAGSSAYKSQLCPLLMSMFRPSAGRRCRARHQPASDSPIGPRDKRAVSLSGSSLPELLLFTCRCKHWLCSGHCGINWESDC